jgi:two-component system CheB/CheR fusion protein
MSQGSRESASRYEARPVSNGVEEHLPRILAEVRRHTGVDLRHYRRPMLLRRVSGRLRLAGFQKVDAYLDRLTRDPEEAERLLGYITIKVSDFFRSPPLFHRLEADVLPALLKQRGGEPVRVWSAGCGYGEEVYSLAIVLAEAAEGTPHPPPVLFATDVDRDALAFAARGRYPRDRLAGISKERLRRFFNSGGGPDDHTLEVGEELRSRVRFLRHDLTTEIAPIDEALDLIVCRNVLIYLERPKVEAIQLSLVRQLASWGYLSLGASEWPTCRTRRCLEVVDRPARLFKRNGKGMTGPE